MDEQTELPQTRKKHHPRLFILLAVAVVLLVALGMYILQNANSSKKSSSTSTTAVGTKRLCFVRLAHLVCTDRQGNDRQRFNLPATQSGLSLVSLATNPAQTAFVATASSNATTEVLLLNQKLQLQKRLEFAPAMIPNTPSLSHDGKSVLLELTGPGNDRHIYRYDLASGSTVKLTSDGANSKPIETKNGRILYFHYSGHGSWLPYMMQADGSGQQPLGSFGSLSTILGFDYDAASDMVFVTGSDKSAGRLAYSTFEGILAGKSITTIPADISSSSDTVTAIDATTVLLKAKDGIVISLPKANTQATIRNIGPIAGMLTTAQFPLSKQQTEQAHDFILNLGLASSDFATYLKNWYEPQNAKCEPGSKLAVQVQAVERGSYAQISKNCGDSGAAVYFAKVQDGWKEILSSQEGVPCDTVNQYAFTRVIIPECYDTNGTPIANVHP